MLLLYKISVYVLVLARWLSYYMYSRHQHKFDHLMNERVALARKSERCKADVAEYSCTLQELGRVRDHEKKHQAMAAQWDVTHNKLCAATTKAKGFKGRILPYIMGIVDSVLFATFFEQIADLVSGIEIHPQVLEVLRTFAEYLPNII